MNNFIIKNSCVAVLIVSMATLGIEGSSTTPTFYQHVVNVSLSCIKRPFAWYNDLGGARKSWIKLISAISIPILSYGAYYLYKTYKKKIKTDTAGNGRASCSESSTTNSSQPIVQSLEQLQEGLGLLAEVSNLNQIDLKRSFTPDEAVIIFKKKESDVYKLAYLFAHEMPAKLRLRAISNAGTLFAIESDDYESIYKINKKSVEKISLGNWTIMESYLFPQKKLRDRWCFYFCPILLWKEKDDHDCYLGVFDAEKGRAISINEITLDMLNAISNGLDEDYLASFKYDSVLVGKKTTKDHYFITKKSAAQLDLYSTLIINATSRYIFWAKDANTKCFCYNVVTKKTEEICNIKQLNVEQDAVILDIQAIEYNDEVTVVLLIAPHQNASKKVSFGTLAVCSYKAKKWQTHTVNVLWPLYFRPKLSSNGKKCVSILGPYHLNDEWAEENMSPLPIMVLLDSGKYVLAGSPDPLEHRKAEIMVVSDDGNYIAMQSGRKVAVWHLQEKAKI